MSSSQLSLIEREIADLTARLVALEKKGRFRRILAYVLKIVAAGSALVIALDVLHDWYRWLAGAALVAIFIDTVSSNHERLIGEARAGHAARASRDKIARDYNRSLQAILNQLKSSSPGSDAYDAAVHDKEILQSETQEKLQKAVSEIEAALAELDLKALKALSLEAEKGRFEKN
jgi:hypothetical protein